jgi:redox-sensitive bicupin YhaK (pirin superfamily)
MDSILQVVTGVEKDIGFTVRRILPSGKVRMVGPFVFFDHMGPASFLEDTTEGDVRPHPHIGLATVTFLFSGAMMHRDHLGYVQRIVPGDVNWMSAGRGIVHSERIPEDIRKEHTPVQGLQMWVALPQEQEAGEPGFWHYPAAVIPVAEGDGYTVKVLAGTVFGQTSPVATNSPTLYAVGTLDAGKTLALDSRYSERAVYTVNGELTVNGTVLRKGELAVLAEGVDIVLEAGEDSTFMLLGGEPLGPRFVWWNFVATDKAMIDRAKLAWENQDATVFPVIPGEVERIPLP